MPEGMKYLLYIIGFITFIYLTIRYIIPLLLRFIAGALSIFIQILLIAVVIFGLVWLIGYFSKHSNR